MSPGWEGAWINERPLGQSGSLFSISRGVLVKFIIFPIIIQEDLKESTLRVNLVEKQIP